MRHLKMLLVLNRSESFICLYRALIAIRDNVTIRGFVTILVLNRVAIRAHLVDGDRAVDFRLGASDVLRGVHCTINSLFGDLIAGTLPLDRSNDS